MTLTEFLLARIAKDEASVAGFWSGAADPEFMWGPGRIRVECEAKRRIVTKAQRANVALDAGINPASAAGSFALTEVLQYLALPYADHPDYRDEWRP